MSQIDDETADADPGPIETEVGFGLPTNEREYIIPAQDAKGHNTRLYCRAPPAVGRLVSDILASRKYPFRTIGDLVRWCIVTGSKRLASGKGIKSVTAQADAIIDILRDEVFQLDFLEVFNNLRSVVDSYLASKAPGEARRVVAQMRAQIEAMPEGYWRSRYQDELLTRYGSLLDAQGESGHWHHDDGDDNSHDDKST
jgi:hypothetical protein